jgi:hypothetical protein
LGTFLLYNDIDGRKNKLEINEKFDVNLHENNESFLNFNEIKENFTLQFRL